MIMNAVLKYVSITCTWLIASALSLQGVEREIIRDSNVQNGLMLLSASPGKRIVYGILPGFNCNTNAVWDLAQWSSKYPLNVVPQKPHNRSIQYTNVAKSIILGQPDSDGVSMAVYGSIEYAGRARKQDEPWVHLLLQQDFKQPSALNELSAAKFHIEARLKSSFKVETSDYSPGLHAAQFQVFFSIQNLNRKSAGFGEYLWFGIPLYDDRHRSPKAHKTQDTGGTKMFIFTPSGETYTQQSAHDKQWITIDKDLLPLVKEGLKTAWDAGFLKDSKSFADYFIAGMNIGWEVPGIFDVEIQFRRLSLVEVKVK